MRLRGRRWRGGWGLRWGGGMSGRRKLENLRLRRTGFIFIGGGLRTRLTFSDSASTSRGGTRWRFRSSIRWWGRRSARWRRRSRVEPRRTRRARSEEEYEDG